MRVRGDEPCIGHLDLFMADRSEPGWKQREAVAIRMCRTCDRRIECYALAAQRGEEHGVWGGVSFRGPSKGRVPAGGVRDVCGTRRGVLRHRRPPKGEGDPEPLCFACRWWQDGERRRDVSA